MLDSLRIGEVVGGYRVDERIGSGGMSVVYAATQLTENRSVALKLLSPHLTDKQWGTRFVAEAEVLKNIDHPGVVRVFEFLEIEEHDAVAIVMERLVGPSLAEALRTRRLTVIQSLNLGLQLARALAVVHASGVIHRDIKPQNLMIIGDLKSDLSEVPAVKLLDFGIAKLPKEQSSVRTRTGHFLGTPAYMAPEQIVSHRIGPAADLYALAEIVVEMLTGRRLFRGDPIALLKRKVAETPDLFLPEKVPFCGELTSCLQACLQPEPARRPSLSVLTALLDKSRGQAGDDPETDRGEIVFELTGEHIVDTDPSPPDLTDAMFEQILLDLGEVNELKPEERPPQRVGEDTPLELMRPEDRDQFWPMPKEEPNVPEVASPKERQEIKAPRRLAGVKAAEAGFAAVETVRRRPWLLPVSIAGGVVLLATLGIIFSSRDDDVLPEEQPETKSSLYVSWETKLEKRRAACARFVLPDPLPLKVLLDAARALHPRDHFDAYRQADVLLCTALVRFPGDDEALATYIENQLLMHGERLDPVERVDLTDLTLLVQERAPQEKIALMPLARLALLRGDGAQAIGYIDRLGGASADPGRELLVRAEALALSNPEEAQRVLERPALAAWEQRPSVRARVFAALGRYASAIESLEPRRAEGDAAALIALGELYAAVGDQSKSREVYTLATTRNGSPGEAALRLAELSGAEDELKTIVAQLENPRSVRGRARLLLARIALGRGDLQGASSLLDVAKSEGAAAAESSQLRAEIAHVSGGANAVIDVLRRAELNEANALLIAAAEVEAGLYEDAARHLEEESADPRVLVLRAVDPAGRKDSMEALASVDPALLADEESSPAFARIMRAIRVPRGPESNVVQGVLAAAAGSVREAEVLLVPEIGRSRVGALYAADLLLRAGKLREAERAAREGLRRAPKSVTLKIALARVLAARDRKEDARRMWSKIPLGEPEPAPALLDRLALEAALDPAAKTALIEAMPRLKRFERARRLSYELGL